MPRPSSWRLRQENRRSLTAAAVRILSAALRCVRLHAGQRLSHSSAGSLDCRDSRLRIVTSQPPANPSMSSPSPHMVAPKRLEAPGLLDVPLGAAELAIACRQRLGWTGLQQSAGKAASASSPPSSLLMSETRVPGGAARAVCRIIAHGIAQQRAGRRARMRQNSGPYRGRGDRQRPSQRESHQKRTMQRPASANAAACSAAIIGPLVAGVRCTGCGNATV